MKGILLVYLVSVSAVTFKEPLRSSSIEVEYVQEDAVVVAVTMDKEVSANTETSEEEEPKLEMNNTEVDALLQTFENDKFKKRYAQFIQKLKSQVQTDKSNFEELDKKLKIANSNAGQGEMGFPFAASKLQAIKDSIS